MIDQRSTVTPAVFDAMPEAFRLRSFLWQLFATLTFRDPPPPRSRCKAMLFAWLRNVAHSSHVHFKYHLLWLARYELGRKTDNVHYHLCIAGLPVEFVKTQGCRAYESLWWTRGGGFAQIEPYDPARDGVGYLLKLSDPAFYAVHGGDLKDNGDEWLPTLSDSLIKMMRRSI
jgi:hypothetical protein